MHTNPFLAIMALGAEDMAKTQGWKVESRENIYGCGYRDLYICPASAGGEKL